MSPFIQMDDLMLGIALEIFSKISVLMTGFVATFFILRVLILNSRFAGSAEYGELFTDIISYFAMTSLYPVLVKLIVGTLATLSKKITFQYPNALQIIEEFLKKLLGESIIVQIVSKIGDIVLFIFVQSSYSILMGLLIAIAPIIIFMALVVKLQAGLTIYFQSLLCLALWPLLWNLIGALGSSMWPLFSTSPIRTAIFWFLIQLLQVASPAFCIALFKSINVNGATQKSDALKGYF